MFSLLRVGRSCCSPLRAANVANRSGKAINSVSTLVRRDFKAGRQWWSAESGAATAEAASAAPKSAPRVVGWWLAGCAGMAFGAVALGGLTRLTESGLSMVDWKLLGRPPPSSAEEWQTELDKYKESPEYQLKNSEITMDDFKFIWYMEYGHRMWGRTIGVFFYLPAAFFWARGYIPAPLKPRILLLGGLLAGQGLLGWYMVKSGLDHKNFEGPSDVPRVSQYRLASHLSTAMVFYSLLLWNSFSVLIPPSAPAAAQKAAAASILGFRRFTMTGKALVFLTAVSGAFVAGLDAGLTYNSFPLMAGRIFPSDLFAYAPFLRNFTENPTTVQFDHRVLGTTTLCFLTYLAYKSRRLPLPGRANQAALVLAGLAWMQVCLGVATLLLYVPTPVAASHQSGALFTLSAALWLSHELKLMKALKHLPK